MSLERSPILYRAAWHTGELLHRRVDPSRSWIRCTDGGRTSGSVRADQDMSTDQTPSTAHSHTAGQRDELRSVSAAGVADDPIPSYRGDRTTSYPLALQPAPDVSNPVLTIRDVSDHADWGCIADPFMFVPETGPWYVFFEIYNRFRSPPAVISHATSTDRGRTWEYGGVVLREDCHLAFPHVFGWRDRYYMTPERHEDGKPADLKLYATSSLPDGWAEIAAPVSPPVSLHDPVVFRWADRWWLVAGTGSELYAYHSDELEVDDWQPHGANPVVTDRPRGARPGGRPIVTDDGILLFLQDCAAEYGHRLRAFEIETLAPDAYVDSERPESPVLSSTHRLFGWNAGKMHHVDPWFVDGQWRCVVDGNIGWGRRLFGRDHWAIGMYDAE